MTLANQITFVRILLVPLFASQVLYYVDTGSEWHRWLALATFGLAAISDGIDGFIARRYNQQTELGAVLDPIADKLLLVCALVLLSFNQQPFLDRVPLWLVLTLMGRDLATGVGFAMLHQSGGNLKVATHWTGKVATALLMGVVVWVLLKWQSDVMIGLAVMAAAATLASGGFYVRDGYRRLQAAERKKSGTGGT